MKKQSVQQMDALLDSIGKIGDSTPEFEFKSKKTIEKLKKCRTELMQEAFNDAFEPNKD